MGRHRWSNVRGKMNPWVAGVDANAASGNDRRWRRY